jgi:hypothetical protein
MDDGEFRAAVAFARELARAPGGRLCASCAEVLSVAGAGITLMSGDRSGPICASNSRIAALEDLQYTAGEGPSRDAFDLGRHVGAPRLDREMVTRWPSFVELARTGGVGAVFAYPLIQDESHVGVLTLYQEAHGDLSDAQHRDSLTVADILAETVLSLQAAAPSGSLAAGLEEAMEHRAEIHQASGMVSLQLAVPVADALARMRARAYSTGVPLAALAKDIVARQVRFAPDGDTSAE